MTELGAAVFYVEGWFPTLYPLTQSVELLHGAAVTLLALGLCILLQGCHRECLLQSQHDLIHLREQNNSSFISLTVNVSAFISLLQPVFMYYAAILHY